LINDPGFKLVRECIRQDIKIDFIPGATSIISALVLSGLPPDKFLFLGYPPAKEQSQKRWLEELFLLINKQKEVAKSLSFTCIILISPHKLPRFLKNMLEVFGDIEVVLAHELTKIHQSVERKKISVWLSTIKNPKGEYVLLFKPD
jgi:16S rRNA (cytidine1402-2'-O)-methyltransferase